MIKSNIKAEYLDHMGSDLTVVNAARASFNKSSQWDNAVVRSSYPGEIYQKNKGFLKQGDANLIRFLATGYRTSEWDSLIDKVLQADCRTELEALLRDYKNKAQHWAPFGHPHVQIRITLPIFLARQFVKHQVGGVWSEESRRYVDDGLEFWFPQDWHNRPEDVKQGSGDLVKNQEFCTAVSERVTQQALAAYETLRAEGVAPEEARIILPHNLMTTVVWTGSLLFWSRVCNQRLDPHAQLAAQEMAEHISGIIQPLFPVSWKHLVPVYDYYLNSSK